LAKLPNKHDGIYLIVDPTSDEICKDIEVGKLEPKADVRDGGAKRNWTKSAAHEIWCWRLETDDANVVVDQTQVAQYLVKIKEHMMNGTFFWVLTEGPFCEEIMCGIRLNIMDVILRADVIHHSAD